MRANPVLDVPDAPGRLRAFAHQIIQSGAITAVIWIGALTLMVALLHHRYNGHLSRTAGLAAAIRPGAGSWHRTRSRVAVGAVRPEAGGHPTGVPVVMTWGD